MSRPSTLRERSRPGRQPKGEVRGTLECMGWDRPTKTRLEVRRQAGGSPLISAPGHGKSNKRHSKQGLMSGAVPAHRAAAVRCAKQRLCKIGQERPIARGAIPRGRRLGVSKHRTTDRNKLDRTCGARGWIILLPALGHRGADEKTHKKVLMSEAVPTPMCKGGRQQHARERGHAGARHYECTTRVDSVDQRQPSNDPHTHRGECANRYLLTAAEGGTRKVLLIRRSKKPQIQRLGRRQGAPHRVCGGPGEANKTGLTEKCDRLEVRR